jgi:hypothetical protein
MQCQMNNKGFRFPYNHLYGDEQHSRHHQFSNHPRNCQHFIGPGGGGGSLPHSQELSVHPHHDPEQSSPYHPTQSLQDQSEHHPPTHVPKYK